MSDEARSMEPLRSETSDDAPTTEPPPITEPLIMRWVAPTNSG